MIERNVGDIITHDSDAHRGIRMWKILDMRRHILYVKVINHECPSMVGHNTTKANTDRYILATPANPNHVAVSSLDYMQSTSLTLEDKRIIKEYLDDKAA